MCGPDCHRLLADAGRCRTCRWVPLAEREEVVVFDASVPVRERRQDDREAQEYFSYLETIRGRSYEG